MKIALVLLVSFAAQAQGLFEEEYNVSRPHREASYQQLLQFAKNLEATKDVDALRAGFQKAIGYPPPGFGAPSLTKMEKIGEDSIATYHRAWVKVAAGMDVYGIYLVPKNVKLPAPLVVSLHGGGGFPELALFKGGTNYHDMIRGAAQHGYVVWAPLTVMYPFRDRDTGTPIPAEVRAELDAVFRQRGTSLMAVEAMRISRSLDVIMHLKEVDSTRIGMVGLSYGGFYTLYTMALDPRIKAGVASCSFRSRDTYQLKPPPAGQPVDAAGPDLVRMIAPRALQVQAGINDKGFPIADVRQGAESVKGLMDYQEFEGGHEWRGDIAWKFLASHL